MVLLGYDELYDETHTWLWDGTNWTDLGMQHPGPMFGATIYDPVRQQVVSFGGEDDWTGATYPNQVWAWNGAQWNVTATLTAQPPHGGTVMYDTARSQFLELASGSYDDIWTWNGAKLELVAADSLPGRTLGGPRRDGLRLGARYYRALRRHLR